MINSMRNYFNYYSTAKNIFTEERALLINKLLQRLFVNALLQEYEITRKVIAEASATSSSVVPKDRRERCDLQLLYQVCFAAVNIQETAWKNNFWLYVI